MAQPKVIKNLFPISVAIKRVIGKSVISMVMLTIYASRQLKSKKQHQYPMKKFSFVHSCHPFCLKLIIGFSRFKVKQDLMGKLQLKPKTEGR